MDEKMGVLQDLSQKCFVHKSPYAFVFNLASIDLLYYLKQY